MFRHLCIAAFRDLVRSPVLSLIAIGGLAIGLTAAILAGTVIANQLGYDHFIPGYERTYIATMDYNFSGRPTDYFADTPHDLAARLKLDFPQIEAVARVDTTMHSLRHGTVEAQETIYEADPTIFRVLPLPVLYGRLDGALDRPDTIVIPLSTAQKYFGRDKVVGETIELDRQHPLKITAVIADLPQNASNLDAGLFLSGRSAFSNLPELDRGPANGPASGNFIIDVQTFVRLAPGASIDSLQRRMLTMSSALLPSPSPNIAATLYLTGLDQFHLSTKIFPGARQRLTILSVVAALILFLAGANFVNLSIARSARRSLEVGIRKVAGASRGAMIAQFLGESVLQALLALCIAVIMAQLSLPAINTFLNSGAALDYWRDPFLVPALVLGALATGVLAGIYPALILSSFRPARVLNGLIHASARAGLVRQILVGLQFMVLTVLLISAGVVFEQYRFATTEALHLKTDQMMFVRVPRCDDSFKTEVATLPGVRGVACSGSSVISQGGIHGNSKLHDGTIVSVLRITVGPGMMELYGLKPVAGRFLQEGRTGDSIPAKAVLSDFSVRMVLNEMAVQKLGLGSPQAAIGKPLSVSPFKGTVIGVVQDYSLNSSGKQVEPTIYFSNDASLNSETAIRPNVLLHVKLDKDLIPQTLAAIDSFWNKTAATGPIQRTFMSTFVENLWLSLLREGQAFSVFAGVAILLACLGLFGLSLFTTQHRTHEIGIRKAMGANSPQIVGLLLWQFGKPVLWANLVAWPIAWWAMNLWLSDFANHVTLQWWLFPAASAATLLIALVTVSGQAIIVARQKPIAALRYE